MRLILQTQQDVHRAVKWYCDGIITAEEYYDAVDERAARMIEDEVRLRKKKGW